MHPSGNAKFRRYENASRVPDASSTRVLVFPSLEEKASWLDSAASLDALRGQVLDHARRFLAIPDAEARTRAIQRWVRDHIHYQFDFRVSQSLPGEEFADTSTSLDRGFGDCDDKARAFVALVRAAEMQEPLGVQTRIRPVFMRAPDDRFTHVQAEVRWPRSHLHDNVIADGWLLAELIVKGCEIGQDPDTIPRLPNGERPIV
jgi:transglutaminase-like putative cysteine protease